MPPHGDLSLPEVQDETDTLAGATIVEISPGLELQEHSPLKVSKVLPVTAGDVSGGQPLPPVFRRKQGHLYWFRKVALLLLLFSGSLSVVVTLFMNLPPLEEGSSQPPLKFPTTLEELKVFRDVMDRYKSKNEIQVAIALTVLYIFLQTFIIPGSIFLNLLAGSLYSFGTALASATVLSTVGCCCCFLISRFLLKDLMYSIFPKKCDFLSGEVQKHKQNLFFFILSLRVAPLLPGWFINIASPVVQVPLNPFCLGTFVGVIPQSFLTVKAGRTLTTISSLRELYDWQTLAILGGFGVLALLPVCVKHRIEQSQSGLKVV